MTRRATVWAGLACALLVAAGVGVGLLVASADDAPARAWSAPAKAPIPAASVGLARAVFDPAGRVHLAWSERRDRRWSLYEAVRRPGGSWSPPTTVVRDRPFAIGVMGIAANAAGRTALVWAYAGDRQGVVVAATRAGGGPWGAEQALSRPVWNAVSGVHVGIDAAGTATVIGRGLDGPGLWATQQTAGGTWQPLRRISPVGLGIDAPTLRVSAGGRVCVLALLKRHGRPPVLWFREADAAGRWGGESLIPRSDHARLPALAATDDGTVVAAWLRETPSSARLLIAARGAAGAWSTPATLERGPSGFVALASLMPEAKGATAVWSDWIRRPPDREVAIRARTITSAGRLQRPATVASLSSRPSRRRPARGSSTAPRPFRSSSPPALPPPLPGSPPQSYRPPPPPRSRPPRGMPTDRGVGRRV